MADGKGAKKKKKKGAKKYNIIQLDFKKSWCGLHQTWQIQPYKKQNRLQRQTKKGAKRKRKKGQKNTITATLWKKKGQK